MYRKYIGKYRRYIRKYRKCIGKHIGTYIGTFWIFVCRILAKFWYTNDRAIITKWFLRVLDVGSSLVRNFFKILTFGDFFVFWSTTTNMRPFSGAIIP